MNAYLHYNQLRLGDNDSAHTVWVGGVEVNDYLLTKSEAEKLAKQYKADGYDDVEIEAVA